MKECDKDVKAVASFGFEILYYFGSLREEAAEITE